MARLLAESPTKRQADVSVFLNLPYDSAFSAQFVAYLCGVCAFGLVPRATLELQGGTRRLDRIVTLIEECRYSIHDLSRVEVDLTPPPTPRFNMPFELGLSVLHASRAPESHTWFLFESVPWRIQKSLSDLDGTDPYIHDGSVDGIFRELAKAFVPLDRQPSVAQVKSLYARAVRSLPKIMANAGSSNPFNARAFRDLVFLLSKAAQRL